MMKHNTVYPKRYVLATGNLTTGFIFHGTFAEHDRAWGWAINNMHVGTEFKIIEMFDVKDDG